MKFTLVSTLLRFTILIFSFFTLHASIGQSNGLVAKNATLQLISKQFSFTEGPAVDKYGNIFFTDQPNNKIWKYDTEGKLAVFLENSRRSNGMYFDKKGNLITCADEENQIISISPKGKIKLLVNDLNGLHFNGPNDLWISPSGGIYFTDPFYLRDYWSRKTPELQGEYVYYLAKNKTPILVSDHLIKPNGIIGTPDGKFLYVADIKGDKTYRFNIAADGSLSAPTLFVEKGADGLTIDENGNIYLTGNGVIVYNPKGELIEHIKVPENWTANVTFGGKDNHTLFITASKAIYSLQMNVKGVPFTF